MPKEILTPGFTTVEKPWLKSLSEVKQEVREKIFEPDYPVVVKLIQRGKPGVPVTGVCEARELYLAGDHPELLVDGFARKFMQIPSLRRVSIMPTS